MNNVIQRWQHLPEHINPVIFSIGNFSLQYYGLMYLVAFTIVYALASHRLKTENRFEMGTEDLQELMVSMILGIIIGARFGYVIFYNFSYYMHNLLEIILPFDVSNGFRFTGISGMSFHGGLIGVVLGVLYFSWRKKFFFPDISDLIVPCVPLGYTFGRLGNFINGELFGRTTTRFIGMFFPLAPGNGLRHPSQLYEAFFEGIVLFLILWFVKKRVKIVGMMLPLYLAGYGLIRFLIEFTRQPDPQLGFVFLRFSMGQVLSFGMIMTGGIMLFIMTRKLSATRRSK